MSSYVSLLCVLDILSPPPGDKMGRQQHLLCIADSDDDHDAAWFRWTLKVLTQKNHCRYEELRATWRLVANGNANSCWRRATPGLLIGRRRRST